MTKDDKEGVHQMIRQYFPTDVTSPGATQLRGPAVEGCEIIRQYFPADITSPMPTQLSNNPKNTSKRPLPFPPPAL